MDRQLQGLSGIARRDRAGGVAEWTGLAEGAESVARTLGFELSGDLGFDLRKGTKDTIVL